MVLQLLMALHASLLWQEQLAQTSARLHWPAAHRLLHPIVCFCASCGALALVLGSRLPSDDHSTKVPSMLGPSARLPSVCSLGSEQ